MNKSIVAIAIAALMIAGGAGAHFLLNDKDSVGGPAASFDPVPDVPYTKDPDPKVPDIDDPIPAVNTLTRYSTYPVENDYRIDYYNNTGLYSIYYIYLGKVNNVPIAWETTQKYNGVTPIELSYTTSKTSDKMISRSNETCITETIESTVSKKNEAHSKVSAGFGIGIIGANVEAGWKAGWGSSQTSSSSVSTTDTYTSFLSWSETNSSRFNVTVGEHGEYPGFYRYTLFATADVYVTVVVDNTNSECCYEYSTFARPGTYFMELDYSEDNDFTKGNEFEKFRFTDVILTDLPSIPLSETIMFLDYRGQNVNSNPLVIPYDTLEVIIIGDASTIITKNIIINARSTDLKITMNNFKFVAPQGKAAVQDLSVTAPQHKINFVLLGDNSITGGNGAKGGNGSPGSSGESGGAGINVTKNHSITVTGNGKLTVTGGNGGAGGNGNDSKSGDVNSRRGGNGGSGGSGIVCNAISLENATGKITVVGGNGGAGGKGGNSTEIGAVLWAGPNLCGGNGGNGGQGGWSIDARTEPNPTSSVSEPLSLIGGWGGTGGAGGAKKSLGADGSAGSGGARALNDHWFNGTEQKLLGSGGA
jgi:hypothetical protein